MKLDHAIQSQKVFNRARHVGINRNYWYPVAWAKDVKAGKVRKSVLWEQALSVFRTTEGVVHVIDDACLHKGVELHKGCVEGDRLVCPYHGWEFDGSGTCVSIPYLKGARGLSKNRIRSYPVAERYNVIWIFPGDPALAETVPLPEMPEYDDPNWLVVHIPSYFQAHFSIINENPLDTFHGHLHRDLQSWYDPVLTSLERDEGRVVGTYNVTFRNVWLARFIGITKRGEKEVTKEISVGYYYPHCWNAMPGVSNYYFMRQPEGPRATRSYGFLCLPVCLPRWLKTRLQRPLSFLLWKFMVKPFLDQDVEMMESEQRRIDQEPDRTFVEINPVVSAAQRLTVERYDADPREAGETVVPVSKA